ncbi:MAG: glycerophosphodiester phosphodiesterase family protein [Bacillota bacterium]|nr:glycerophosphodiester phosphodiesterase family protein [Bacillota bacterium]MDD4263444.1 glycerophosphodiester phosphodiesterase family protein [Bacillota bacterium]
MTKRFNLFFVVIMLCLFSLTSLASSETIEAYEGTWVFEEEAIVTKIDDNPDIDFNSAYFNQTKDSFYFETDFTIEESKNLSRWFGVSYRTPEDKTLSHMLRVKQNTTLGNGIELTFLTEDRWRRQLNFAGEELLEIGVKYNFKMAVSNDYLIVLLNDKPILATKCASNVAEGLVGLHAYGMTVRFENTVLSDYPADEMVAYEEIANWQAGRDRAAAYPTIPIIVAHRGNSSEAPENTMASVKSAIAVGADAVEIDVYRTIDGELVLLHDSSLERTTNGTGDVKTKTYDYLKTLDAGSSFNRKFAGEPIPLLRDVLLEIKDKVTLVIELKQAGIERDVLDLIIETGTRDQVVVIAFNAGLLANFYYMAPDIPTSVLSYSTKTIDEVVALAATGKTRSVDLNYGVINKEMATYLIGRGYSLWAWTVNNVKDMQRMVDLGASVITTDNPRAAIDYFRPLN